MTKRFTPALLPRRIVAATACLLAASIAARADETSRLEVVPSPAQPADERQQFFILAQPTPDGEQATAVAADEADAIDLQIATAAAAAEPDATAKPEPATTSQPRSIKVAKPRVVAPQPQSIKEEPASVTKQPLFLEFNAVSTDARPAADALLQATDAHRKAFAEMANCRSCHATPDGHEKHTGFHLFADNVWRQALIRRSGDDEQKDSGPKIGVTVGPVDDVLRAQLGLPAGRGLVVTEVLPETPAQRAGVEAHDLLVAVAGSNLESEDEFVQLLRQAKPGGPPVGLRLIRGGQPLEVSVVPLFPPPPGSQPAMAGVQVKTAPPTPAQPRYRIGISLAPADDTLRQQLSLGDTGVVILDVMPNTPAERQGLRAYDVVTRAAGRPIRQERDMVEAVQAAKDAKLELEYVRAGKRQYIAVAPEVAPPEPTATLMPPGHPRELYVLPGKIYGLEGEHVVASPDVTWGQIASGRAATTAPSAAATAEQLDRIAAEIQQLRAALDALRDRVSVEEKQAKPEKK